jgi:hypothetical protein
LIFNEQPPNAADVINGYDDKFSNVFSAAIKNSSISINQLSYGHSLFLLHDDKFSNVFSAANKNSSINNNQLSYGHSLFSLHLAWPLAIILLLFAAMLQPIPFSEDTRLLPRWPFPIAHFNFQQFNNIQYLTLTQC